MPAAVVLEGAGSCHCKRAQFHCKGRLFKIPEIVSQASAGAAATLLLLSSAGEHKKWVIVAGKQTLVFSPCPTSTLGCSQIMQCTGPASSGNVRCVVRNSTCTHTLCSCISANQRQHRCAWWHLVAGSAAAVSDLSTHLPTHHDEGECALSSRGPCRTNSVTA